MRFRMSILFSLALLVTSCASTPVQKAQQASVDLHAVLAAVQDSETALCNKGGDGECLVSAEIDPALVAAVRREFPALEDRVFK